MRSEPIITTWLLNHFCSDDEHAFVAGDLLEQYHAGRGDFWYTRQVLGIVCLALYDKTLRRPLVSPKGYQEGENLLLSALLFAWATVLGPVLIVTVSIIATASVFVLPSLNHERHRKAYYLMGCLLLLEMTLIVGPGILLLMTPLLLIEACILLCWHKFSRAEYQVLGLSGRK